MKTSTTYTSFLSGVLDPRASARVDSEAYKQALRTGINIEISHLGGAKRRRGSLYRTTLPNTLTRITAGVTPTAPNGGTASNANDGSTATSVTTTTPVGTTNPFVVIHYDLGAATLVKFADVLGIASTLNASIQFCIQYSTDNSTWVTVGSAFAGVDTTARDYRREAGITARYWRVARVGSTNMSTSNITLTEFNLWTESSTISNVRCIAFEVSSTQKYLVAITDRSIAVIEDGVVLDLMPSPYANADVLEIDGAASEGELVLVHEDYAPRTLFYAGNDTFQSELLSLSNIPVADYNDDSSPTPVSAVQVITFTNFVAGNVFQIDLQGARTANITYAGDSSAVEQSATAANIAREIQKLYTVRGFEGVSCARTGSGAYTVTFAAGSADDYELMAGTPITAGSTAAIAVTESAAGTARTEPVWSSTRGYPRTVAFFEGRLYFGGSRSNPQSLFGSTLKTYYDFDLGSGLDSDAIFVTLTGQQTNIINGLLAGRSLMVFTSGGEFRYVKPQGDPVTPSSIPVNQTQYGSAKIRPTAIDGAGIYVQRTLKTLRDFKYDYAEDSFTSRGLSSLAPHLVTGIVDLAAWAGSSTDELNLVFAANSDGTMAVLSTNKEAEAQALVTWTTDGEYRAAAVVDQGIYFAVKRTFNSVSYLFLEQASADAYTDCAVQVSNGSPSATVTGLDHLDGKSCRVRADEFVLGDATPASGSITIPEGTFTDVEVGLNFNPTITPMPLVSDTPSGPDFMKKRRIVRVAVKVKDTLGLLVNGRVLPDRSADVDNFDDPATPYTGVHTIEETTNWDESDEKTVSFTQVDPLPMEILGVYVTTESAG